MWRQQWPNGSRSRATQMVDTRKAQDQTYCYLPRLLGWDGVCGNCLMTIDKKKLCKVCGLTPRRKHTRGKCTSCAIKSGFKVCSKCKAMYQPTKARQRTCGKCFTRAKSVWSVASAGAPTLGKRKWNCLLDSVSGLVSSNKCLSNSTFIWVYVVVYKCRYLSVSRVGLYGS